MKHFFKIIFIAFFFILAGCKSINVHGQHISDQTIEEVNKQKLTQNQLQEALGTPTFIPLESNDVWYYIQRTQSQRLWFSSKVEEQRIVKIVFDENDKVVKAELVKNTHNESVAASRSYTEAKGTKQSGTKKFIKNLGRFTKGKKKPSNRSKKSK